MRARYPVHIPRYLNRQLLQVVRPCADRSERGIMDADVHRIQTPQGFAPVTDQIGTEAGGEHSCVGVTRPDGQRLERRPGEDGK